MTPIWLSFVRNASTNMRDAGVSYGTAIALVALAQVVVVTVVITSFPETAHLELEAINPVDAVPVSMPPVPGTS